MTEPHITARGWGWRHAGRHDWAVSELSFDIMPGERVLLLGSSGSGKSTVLHAVAGVLGGSEEGEEQGQLLVNGRHPTRTRGHAGLVMQDPESNIILARVGDDVAFGCENLGVPRDEIWSRVRWALDVVGLDVSLDRSTAELSGGQKQRLALAGALAMQVAPGEPVESALLLLDEPTANLDRDGVREVPQALTGLLQDARATLLVVEHRVSVWVDLMDRVIVLDDGGGLLADGPPDQVFTLQREALLAAGVWVPGSDLPRLDIPRQPAEPAPLAAEDLVIGYQSANPVSGPLQLAIPGCRSTVFTGGNGAGKTTLALTMAGLLPPLGGRVAARPDLQPAARAKRWSRRAVVASNPATWRSRDLLTRIGTVFQEPEHQFVTSTVRHELEVGLRTLDWRPDRVAARVTELLEALHLTPLAGANPFTLSGGEKRRLSVGTVLATSPHVVLLDEPTFGQDRNTWLDMVRLVARMLADDRTVISVTHDEEFIGLLGQNVVAVGAL